MIYRLMVVLELTDKGCIIWLYTTTMLLIILLSILKEKDFNSIPLLSGRSTNEEENGKEYKEPDYDEDENQLEGRQEAETEEIEEETTNQVF
jgi:hypothetical protein